MFIKLNYKLGTERTISGVSLVELNFARNVARITFSDASGEHVDESEITNLISVEWDKSELLLSSRIAKEKVTSK